MLSSGQILSAALEVGAPAPHFQLADTTGRPVSNTNFLGKVVIVNFFTTWCVPCVWEVPDFTALQNKYWRQGLVVVGVAVRQRPKELMPFMKTHMVNYHVLPSTDKVLWDYGVLPRGAVPVTVVIDRQGKVHASWTYYHTKSYTEKIIAPLLKPLKP